MPDLYAAISEATTDVQQRLAGVLEQRAADPRQRDMLRAYLSDIDFPEGARVLEIGCGTGAVTRALAGWPRVAEALGVDPSPVFIAKARELSAGARDVSYEVADGRALPLGDGAFDVAVLHTALCHIPAPERVLAEAKRVLRAGGWLAVFEGDYATATVGTGSHDPLEPLMDAFREGFVHDPWMVRRLPGLLAAAGFRAAPTRSHGYTEAPRAGYMLSWVERGADLLAQQGRIGKALAEGLKAEARRRSEAGAWFGFIGFASVLARKPG